MWKWLNFNPLRTLAPKLPLHPSGTFYAQSGATTDASRRTTCESPGPAAHLSGEKKRKKKKKTCPPDFNGARVIPNWCPPLKGALVSHPPRTHPRALTLTSPYTPLHLLATKSVFPFSRPPISSSPSSSSSSDFRHTHTYTHTPSQGGTLIKARRAARTEAARGGISICKWQRVAGSVIHQSGCMLNAVEVRRHSTGRALLHVRVCARMDMYLTFNLLFLHLKKKKTDWRL